MNSLSLNIGLAVGNIDTATETLDPLTALHAIADHLPATQVKDWYVRIHPLTGEPTLVVRCTTRIAGPNTLAPCIHDLCLATRQDCIAGKLAVGGGAIHEFLTGPKAADYGGAFDETYWLAVTCDNAPQPVGATLANVFADRTLAGWTLGRMENESMTLWFEHSSGTEENGGNCYLELSADGAQVDLIDADGTFSLPKPVITLLRQAGVFVDSTFE